MRQAWNGAKVNGQGLFIEGKISNVKDDGTDLTFRVDTDGVLRTVSMAKAGATIRIEAPGTITITEAPNA